MKFSEIEMEARSKKIRKNTQALLLWVDNRGGGGRCCKYRHVRHGENHLPGVLVWTTEVTSAVPGAYI